MATCKLDGTGRLDCVRCGNTGRTVCPASNPPENPIQRAILLGDQNKADYLAQRERDIREQEACQAAWFDELFPVAEYPDVTPAERAALKAYLDRAAAGLPAHCCSCGAELVCPCNG